MKYLKSLNIPLKMKRAWEESVACKTCGSQLSIWAQIKHHNDHVVWSLSPVCSINLETTVVSLLS